MRCLSRGGWLALLAVWMWAFPALAQISVGLQFPYKNFLLYEPIQVEVVLKNELGGPIILRPDGQLFTLEIDIRSHRNNRAERTGKPLVSTLHTINSMETVAIPINLLDTHHFLYPGTYHITASVTYRGQTFSSIKHYIDISEGRVIQEIRTFEPPRLFTLRTCNRNGIETLLMRIDDAANERHFGVYPLGRMLRSNPPQVALEAGSVVHVLHRLTPRQYMHSRFSAGGVPLGQEVLKSSSAQAPVLGMGPDGNMTVSGAQQGPLGQDSLDLKDIGIGPPPSGVSGRRAPRTAPAVDPDDPVEF